MERYLSRLPEGDSRICACLEIEGAGMWAHWVIIVRHETKGHTEGLSLMS